MAAERANLLFGCYRKAEASDPTIYSAAITAILAAYPAEVITRVTDPRVGIARTHKFLPSVAEVAEACDEAKRYLDAETALKEKGWHWDGQQWSKS